MDWLYKRDILVSKIDAAAEINKILLDFFQTETIEYKSRNSVLEVDDGFNQKLSSRIS